MHPLTGRTLWILLHAFAQAYPDTPEERDKKAARYFLGVFSELVREASAGCGSCYRKWSALLSRTPPDLSSREAFHLWTVAAHDRINREIGKPLAFPAISVSHPVLAS